MKQVHIEVFSDVLCVWAYSAQARIDELKRTFREQIDLQYRFIPIFAATKERVGERWKDRGAYAGFNRHLHEAAA